MVCESARRSPAVRYITPANTEPGKVVFSAASHCSASAESKSSHASLGHRHSAARVSKRLSDKSAACLRARRCTNLAWFDLVVLPRLLVIVWHFFCPVEWPPAAADLQTPKTVWQIAFAKLQSWLRGHHKYPRMRPQLFDQIVFSGSRYLPEQVQRSS